MNPLPQTNPCVNGMFDIKVATLFPPVPAGLILQCTLAPHILFGVTADDNQTMA